MTARPGLRPTTVVTLVVLQLAVLSIGLGREYRLKHEDNNALYATFARSHLTLGLGVTRAQNYRYEPATEQGAFYAHHPPGPSLVLAAVYGVTGRDDPLVTRGTAVAFHLLATVLFYGLARRVLRTPRELLVAMLAFVGVAQSTFFGRMVNHEVFVLPAGLLMVRGFWDLTRADPGTGAVWSRPVAWGALIGGAVWGALSGWAAFLVMGVCIGLGLLRLLQGERRATLVPTGVLAVSAVGLFALDVGHLVWILGGDVSYLWDLLRSRSGTGNAYGPGAWLGRIVELHWRYFGLTSLVGLVLLGGQWIRTRASGRSDPAVELGGLFLLAGLAYVVVFNANAAQHDYWQFLWLPASALGLALVYRRLQARVTATGAHRVWVALLGLAVVDVTVTAAYTLQDRHARSESYCLEVVAELERNAL